MLARMFRVLYPNTKITDLNKSVDKKVILHAYNNPCIPQMGVCEVTRINKVIKYQFSFFVVAGNGPALLGMPDCERLQQLSINCETMNNEKRKRQVNVKKENNSKINKDIKKLIHTLITNLIWE